MKAHSPSAQTLSPPLCLHFFSCRRDKPALLFVAQGPALQQLIALAECNGSHKVQDKLLPVARAAASLGDALCMHYFHWPQG